jgi:hypothetical protein
MAEGLTGPGDVGRYFDHERINQGQMDGAFVRAESVLGGLADLFGPWIPGLQWAELAAQLTPYPGGENGGPADNAQPPVHRQARDDRLRLYQRTYNSRARRAVRRLLGPGTPGLSR